MDDKNNYSRKSINYSLTDIFEIYFNNLHSDDKEAKNDKGAKDEKNTFKTRIRNADSRKSITPNYIVEKYFTYKKSKSKINSIPFACADFFALIYQYYYKSPECDIYKSIVNKSNKYDMQDLDFKQLNNNLINIINSKYKITTKKILSLEPSYIFVKSSLQYIPKISNAINQIIISLFNIDEASSDLTYQLAINKLYTINDLINNFQFNDCSTKENTNKYYSLLNAFLNGYDTAKKLNIQNEWLNIKKPTVKQEKELDDLLSKKIPEIIEYNYYDLMGKYIFTSIFDPLLYSILENNNNIEKDYDLQPIIEWIYKYGNQFDVENLWKTICEIKNTLYEFANNYSNLEHTLLNFYKDNNTVKEHYIQLNKCISFWENHAEYGIRIDNTYFFGINNMFKEISKYNGNLPEELANQLNFNEANELLQNFCHEIKITVMQENTFQIRKTISLSDDYINKIHNIYNCYIASYGCYILNFIFNGYINRSIEARGKYLKEKEEQSNEIDYLFKKQLEEFCMNTWKNKINSALNKKNRYFEIKDENI